MARPLRFSTGMGRRVAHPADANLVFRDTGVAEVQGGVFRIQVAVSAASRSSVVLPDMASAGSGTSCKERAAHWIIIDEAHHLLLAELAGAGAVASKELKNVALVTVHPDAVSAQILSSVTGMIVVGKDPAEGH